MEAFQENFFFKCTLQVKFSHNLAGAMRTTIFFLLLASSAFCQRKIINPEVYLEKIYHSIAAQILAEPNTSLKFNDFEGALNISQFEKVLVGTAKFHSGYISRIGKFQLNSQKYEEVWNDTHVC